jgi:hypothetical protein
LDVQREEKISNKGSALQYTHLNIRYTFWAADGSSVDSSVAVSAMDSGDKSGPKCLAIAHKYALLQAFLVPTEEQKDPDAEAHELANRQQQCLVSLTKAAQQGKAVFAAEWKKWPKEVKAPIDPEQMHKLQSLCAEADK